jgi:DNA polymerase III delta subunit
MSQKQFFDEAKQGLPSPVYYVYAKDPYLLKHACDEIQALVPEEKRDFSLMPFDMDPSQEQPPEMHNLLDVLNTPGFFGERKTVILHNAQLLKKNDLSVISSYFQNPSPDAVFVMFSAKSPASNVKEKLKGIRVINLDMKGHELKRWLLQKARRRGIELTNEAVDFLIAVVGLEAGRLSSEVEKLSLLSRKKIDVADVSEILHGSAKFTVFQLTDAIIEKDEKRAFRIYGAIKNDIDPFSTMGAINWKFADIYRKGKGHKRGYFPRVFRCLSEADMRLKSSGGDYPLEDLLIRLLQI